MGRLKNKNIKIIRLLIVIYGIIIVTLILIGNIAVPFLKVDEFDYYMLLVLCSIIFCLLYNRWFNIIIAIKSKKYQLYEYSFKSNYNEMNEIFKRFLKKRKYNIFKNDFTINNNLILYYKMKYSSSYPKSICIVIFDGNEHDISIKSELAKQIYGDYYIINIVRKSLSKNKFDEYVSYCEEYNSFSLNGPRKFLNILIDFEKNRLYISKIIKPNNGNTLYRKKKIKEIEKVFNLELVEEKNINNKKT